MKNFLAFLLALIVGIAASACREEVPLPEPEEIEPDIDTDEEIEPDIDTDEETEAVIEHELELIDALEIDAFWNKMLAEDVESVFEYVLHVCAEVEAGTGMQNVVLDVMNDGVPYIAASHMLEAAIFIVCPEFIPDYESYLGHN